MSSAVSKDQIDSRTVRVLYFAYFRETRGVSEEKVRTTCRTPLELYRELSKQHGLPFDPENVRVAVNDDLCAWEAAIEDGDTVVFLAPFGGG